MTEEIIDVNGYEENDEEEESICDHSYFLPEGSLCLIETSSKSLTEGYEVHLPNVYLAYCTTCAEFVTEPAYTVEETKMRVKYGHETMEPQWNLNQ